MKIIKQTASRDHGAWRAMSIEEIVSRMDAEGQRYSVYVHEHTYLYDCEEKNQNSLRLI